MLFDALRTLSSSRREALGQRDAAQPELFDETRRAA